MTRDKLRRMDATEWAETEAILEGLLQAVEDGHLAASSLFVARLEGMLLVARGMRS